MRVRASPRPALRDAARWDAAAAMVLLAAAALVALRSGVAPGRLAMLLVVAPLAEEALLRAGLHEALLRRAVQRLVANVVCALVFALAHALLRGDAAALAVAQIGRAHV